MAVLGWTAGPAKMDFPSGRVEHQATKAWMNSKEATATWAKTKTPPLLGSMKALPHADAGAKTSRIPNLMATAWSIDSEQDPHDSCINWRASAKNP